MGEPVLSWAGEYARFISNPLFLFLVLRWLWRFAVWTLLLSAISKLSLRLTPMHPDKTAGLGFLTIYPGIFSGFIFALSCVVAAAVIKELQLVTHSQELVWFFLGGWLVIIRPRLVLLGIDTTSPSKHVALLQCLCVL